MSTPAAASDAPSHVQTVGSHCVRASDPDVTIDAAAGVVSVAHPMSATALPAIESVSVSFAVVRSPSQATATCESPVMTVAMGQPSTADPLASQLFVVDPPPVVVVALHVPVSAVDS
jgi:hypothetical protein